MKKMTKIIIAAALCLGVVGIIASCRTTGPAEKAGKRIDQAVTDTKDKAREVKDDIKEKSRDIKDDIKEDLKKK